ncbi:TRAP transporter large permease [Jiella pacifica]|uniref:TRAP transporter large permease protein n=1 Tax=Jiella pacifica TaxID=2696469 RepID=A0A6N9T0D7_9HYPH|nr:TRAP transporter large permease [Jiella pacifica]NDW03665.1 TRAP transporter large permease subunit [Jiella pacifica]
MLALVIFLLALVLLGLGFEMFLVLGLPGLAIKSGYFGALPDIVVGQKIVAGINQSTLLAIPFFIFAAELMASGRIARDLTSLVKAFLGHRAGGIGYTTIAGCAAFGAVSGSAPATVAALGRIMYPELIKAGYRERFALGLIVSSAETALLIPPSITLIIYGWLTGTSIAGLFAGGLVIGIFLALAFGLYVFVDSIFSDRKGTPAMPWGERLAVIRAAGWALGLPVIILGGIYGGIFTPTEAAAVSVVYAVLVEAVVYRELGLRDLFRVAGQAAITNSVIFILLGMGSLVSYFITLGQFPALVIDFMQTIGANWLVFLLIVNVLFLLAGMFIDPNSALLLLVPALYPVAMTFGIDPIHFGLIVCLNICIGMITPPFGLDIFVASSTLDKPVMTIIAGVWPFVLINIATLLVVTYVPQLSTFLPKLILG